MTHGGATQLRLDFTDRGRGDIRSLAQWLMDLSEDAAARFAAVLNTELSTLCQNVAERIADGHRPGLIDETGSVAFSKPVYRLTVTTQKKRTRRSAAGTYFVYYELLARTGASEPDTVRILAVVHAASAPLTNWLNENE